MTFAYTAAGGIPPYTFSVVSGTLPGGLTLNASTGAITGTPTTAGTFGWTARVTDSVGSHAEISSASIISAVVLPLSITGDAPNGTPSVPYSFAYTVSGGTGPYTVTLLSGTLPPGLTLSSAGVLSGTPTTVGTYSWTVRATDSASAQADLPDFNDIVANDHVAHRYWKLDVTAVQSGAYLLAQGQSGFKIGAGGSFITPATVLASSESFEPATGLFNDHARWSTAFSGHEWVVADLGAAYAVDTLSLLGNSAFASRTFKDFTVQWSDDGVAWNTCNAFTSQDLTHDVSNVYSIGDSGAPIASGLVLWLDARDLTVADGAGISGWGDRSPARTVVVVPGGSPLLRSGGMAGKPAIDGSEGGYFGARIDWTDATEGTIFAVFLNKAAGFTPMGLGFGPAGGENTCWMTFNNSNCYDANLSSARVNTDISSHLTELLSPSLYTVYSGASGGKVRLNGVDILSNPNAFQAPPSYAGNGQYVGQSGGDIRTANQLFSTVLVYNRQLTSTEITDVEAFLTAQWL